MSLKAEKVAAAALALTFASVGGCDRRADRVKPPQPGDVAVATVDGRPIWASDIRREATAQGLIRPGQTPDSGSAQFHQLLDEVIDQKVLAAEARAERVQDDPL